MDINLLLENGMMSCGRVLKVLPKDGPDGIKSPSQYMMKVLRTKTLPSLNILHPILLRKDIHTGALIPYADNDESWEFTRQEKKVMSDDRYLKYRIPLEITDGHEIMSIKSCVPIHAQAGGIVGTACGVGYESRVYGNKWGRTSSADLYGAAMMNMVEYADRQLMGTMKRNFRFYFFTPNILAVTEGGSLNIEFCLKNDENLLTIDDMAFEGVLELFILDLKSAIYNEFGNYTEISNPGGDYDLKIQNWESAEQERKEVYKEYRAKSHLRRSSIRS